MVATVSEDEIGMKPTDTWNNINALQTDVLKGARSSTLRSWAQKALNGGDFKLAAEASLELLSRDINDFEAHSSLL